MNSEIFKEFIELTSEKDILKFSDSLVERALNIPLPKFTLLNNFEEYLTAKEFVEIFRGLSGAFSKSEQIALDTHLEQLICGFDSLKDITQSHVYSCCKRYYAAIAEDLLDKISEFRSYMFSGNFLSMVQGRERPFADMKDFRK